MLYSGPQVVETMTHHLGDPRGSLREAAEYKRIPQFSIAHSGSAGPASARRYGNVLILVATVRASFGGALRSAVGDAISALGGVTILTVEAAVNGTARAAVDPALRAAVAAAVRLLADDAAFITANAAAGLTKRAALRGPSMLCSQGCNMHQRRGRCDRIAISSGDPCKASAVRHTRKRTGNRRVMGIFSSYSGWCARRSR